MTETGLFPQSYEQWRTCITVRCGIPLTRSFVETRLEELRDGAHPGTSEFREKYGAAYLDRVIGWFETARGEVT